MATTIWKYRLTLGPNEIEVQRNSRVVSTLMVDNAPVVYVSSKDGKTKRKIEVFVTTTGANIPPRVLHDYTFLGSIASKEGLVYHVYVKDQ